MDDFKEIVRLYMMNNRLECMGIKGETIGVTSIVGFVFLGESNKECEFIDLKYGGHGVLGSRIRSMGGIMKVRLGYS